MDHQTKAIRLILLNDEPWNTRMNEYAAANPDDLPQAAADFCDQALGPILDINQWAPKDDLAPRMPDRSLRSMLGEVLPTGSEYWIVDMVADLMQQATAD